jgi:hypothetical protein
MKSYRCGEFFSKREVRCAAKLRHKPTRILTYLDFGCLGAHSRGHNLGRDDVLGIATGPMIVKVTTSLGFCITADADRRAAIGHAERKLVNTGCFVLARQPQFVALAVNGSVFRVFRHEFVNSLFDFFQATRVYYASFWSKSSCAYPHRSNRRPYNGFGVDRYVNLKVFTGAL